MKGHSVKPRSHCTRLVLLLSVFALLCLFVYFYLISVHRVQDFEDVHAIVRCLQQPLVNDRCRQFNASHVRCLPNVLFIGASKCGTTSLVQYLTQHPNVSFVNRRIHNDDKHREVHRFDRNTYRWAVQAIDLADEWASSPVVSSPDTTVIHYTPHYFFAPTVPFAVRKFYPHSINSSGYSNGNSSSEGDSTDIGSPATDAVLKYSRMRFVVMLREPVQRAWSSYWFHNSHLLLGKDRGSVDEFMRLARKEIAGRSSFERCFVQQLDATFSRRIIATSSTALDTNTSRSDTLQYLSLLFSCDQICSIRRANEASYSADREVRSDESNRRSSDAAITYRTIGLTEQCNCGDTYNAETQHQQQQQQHREVLRSALKRCFGSQLYGSALGHRHIEKGIFIDQIARWIVNFEASQFLFITLEEFSKQPRETFKRVIEFMGTHRAMAGEDSTQQQQQQEAVLDSIDFSMRRLEKPNARGREQQLSLAQRNELVEFYEPYNRMLSAVLGRQLPF